mgnify:FL=1
MRMGVSTRTGSVSVKSDYSLRDIESMQRFLSTLERSMKMKMTAENLHFWLISASDLHQPELFKELAETLTTSPHSSQEAGIDLWIKSVSEVMDTHAKEEEQRAALFDEKVEAITSRFDDE